MSDLINMMGQVNALKSGAGVQSLLDAAYKILGNPLFMFDTDYKLLAYTEVVTDDPVWNEMITYGTFCKETQEFFKDEGFVEVVANAKRITFMNSDKLKYKRILGKIFNMNNTHVANLVMVACNKPFGSDDPTVFQSICILVTREISKSVFYQEYEKIYQESLIKNLIEGNYADRELYTAHVATIYDSLKDNLYLAVVDISQCDSHYTKLVYFRDLFKQVQFEYKYAIYNNYIIIIISKDEQTLNVNEELNELNKIFEQNNIYAGISSKFENLFELHKYYKEALKALEYVLESKSNQRVFPCDINSINTMEKLRALKTGMGVQHLLNEAFRILGNPVLLHDMEFKLLACSEKIKVDSPIWEEFITYGIMSDDNIEFFRNEGFLDAVANTQTVTFLSSEKIRYNLISGKLFNKENIMVGAVVMIASNNPLGDDKMALFGAFCKTLSQEVSRSEHYNNYGQAYSETLISKLIDGNVNNYALFSQNIINIFDNLKDNLYLSVVDMTSCAPEYAKLKYFRDLFKQLQTVNRYAIYSNYLLIIISSDNISLNAELNEIKRLFEQNSIHAGISSRFENVYELQKHYAEVVNALNNGLKNKK